MTTLLKWNNPFSLTSNSEGGQLFPVVQALENGTFVAVWSAFGSGVTELWMRTFYADGTPVSAETKIRLEAGDASKELHSITVLANGNLLVAWQDQISLNGETSWGVWGQIFNSSGVKISSDLHFNSAVAGYQGNVSVATLVNGGFAVSYSDVSNPATGVNIRTRVFDDEGHAVLRDGETSEALDDIIVNKTSDGNQEDSATIALNDGRYAVLYKDDSSGSERIVGRIFKANGALDKDTEFAISDAANVGRSVTAATLMDGRFVAVWESYIGGSTGAVLKARIFNAEDEPDSIELTIKEDATAVQGQPHVVALPNGGFAVPYKSVGNTTDFRVATFAASGVPVSEFAIQAPEGWVLTSQSKLTVLADGRLVVSWSDGLLDGSDREVHAQIFDPRTGAINLSGTNQDDQYIGTGFNDILSGAGGNDRLTGAGGNDVLSGGAGFDTLIGGTGDDVYYMEAGDVVIEEGGGGYDVIVASYSAILGDHTQVEVLQAAAGTAALSLGGANMNDTLIGNQGHNVLNGGTGADHMAGDAGNDVYYVDNVFDAVVESSASGGVDLVYSSVNYALSAFVENLTATATAAITLTGNTLHNTLTGNAAANRINGGTGNDTVYGGRGNDLLSGGAGKDVFVFDTPGHKSRNKDKILDWSSRDDTLRLDNAIFKKLSKTGKLHSKHFTLGAKAKDGNDFIGVNKATGDVWYDANASKAGGQVIFANISKNKAAFASDFIVF
jgi:Ca2+-binding RTX toxin-like protein